MSWVQTVLGEAQRQGIDATSLLGVAGIRADELNKDRLPIDHITRLWRAAASLSQDAGFGLKAGLHVGPASFNVVSFILQSAATLRDAFATAQKYQRLISDGGRIQLLPGDEASWLVYHPRQGDLAFSPHQIEAVLAAIVRFAKWLSPSGLGLQVVRFSHAQLGPRAGYRQAFGCPVEFEQAYSGLLVSNAVLDRALPQANPQLAQVHEQHAALHLKALTDEGQFDHLVRTWLITHQGPPLPTRTDAARAFGLSERTFARRLLACGTHFAAMLDELRKELALQQVAQTQEPFEDIALHLGFAGASPFYRAFDRWVGTTPGEWRQRAKELTHQRPPAH